LNNINHSVKTWWELCHEVRDLVVVGVRHDSGLAAGKGKAAKALGVFGAERLQG